jgi:hypothetical protein
LGGPTYLAEEREVSAFVVPMSATHDLAGARSIGRPLCASRYLPGMSHVLRFEDIIQLGFAEQIFFEHEFVDAAVGDESFLRDGGTLFVTEHRVERRRAASRAGGVRKVRNADRTRASADRCRFWIAEPRQ